VAEAAGDRIVLTGLGLVSPLGCSPADLLAGVPAGADEPEERWFDAAGHLGPRGFRYLTPATRYLLAAARLALADAGAGADGYEAAERGVVVGTNFAAAPVLRRMDEVVRTEGAAALSPAESPSFSVNIPASHVSMRHSMRAFNLSLTNPVVAGLESLVLLQHCIRRGRAAMGLAAATEDRATPGAAESAAGAPGRAGACALVLEREPRARRRGARVRAEVAGGFSRFVAPGDGAAGRARAEALAALGRRAADLVRRGEVVHYSPPTPALRLGRLVDQAVRESLDGLGVALVEHRYPGSAGELFTVSPLLQAAASVTEHGAGLVVAVSPHGHVAAACLRSAAPGAGVPPAGGST
jgi:3-oxoacyl-[acyl-carrier-protein] synthase II